MTYKKFFNQKEISVIITLYKTPLLQLKKLVQYQDFKLIILSQKPDHQEKNILKGILRKNFTYYSIKKNIGLSRASNFLLSKVKTKYCLFTQADVEINLNSISLLKLALMSNKDGIISSPRFVKTIYNKNNLFKKIKLGVKNVKSFDAACFLFNVKKMKKIGFFDEDFFLYWEDIFLLEKLKKERCKILYVKDALAVHNSGRSTEYNYKTFFIRTVNFKFGEYLFDYKMGKFRFIKILRNIINFPLYLLFYLSTFQLKKLFIKLFDFFGIMKFIFFYLKNDQIKKING